MTSLIKFHCPKHGDIGVDALHVPTLLKLANVTMGYAHQHDMSALVNREYICARCASEMIDAAFLPLRRK